MTDTNEPTPLPVAGYAAMLREDERRVLVSLEALQQAADQSRNTAFKTGVTALLKQFGR